MKARKILLITSGYPIPLSPHYGIYVKRQVEFLEASGEFCFDVLTPGDSRKGVYSIIKYFRFVLQVLNYSLTHNDFDLIHAHEVFPAGLLALIPKMIRKKKLIITLHGGPLYSLNAGGNLINGLIYLTLRFTDKLICVSQYLRERVGELFVIQDEIKNTEVINMGVALDQFKLLTKNEARVWLELGFINPNKKIVMFVGNLIERKGGIYLVEAAKILQDKEILKKIAIVFVGHGPEEEKLRSEALRLGISNDIYFVGQKPPEEIYLWMSAADILTVPSLNEGFGLVALEAMSCGTPVISSNRGGLKEFVIHDENGLLVEGEDANGLAEGIIHLMENPLLYQKIVNNGMKVAQENSVERQALRVGKIYCDLIMGGDR